jgi:hypothetical protein
MICPSTPFHPTHQHLLHNDDTRVQASDPYVSASSNQIKGLTFGLAEDVDHFMKYGYIVVRNAFTAEQAADFTKDLWVRLGMDPNDPATWTKEKVHMPRQQEVVTKEFMPKVSVCV